MMVATFFQELPMINMKVLHSRRRFDQKKPGALRTRVATWRIQKGTDTSTQ